MPGDRTRTLCSCLTAWEGEGSLLLLLLELTTPAAGNTAGGGNTEVETLKMS